MRITDIERAALLKVEFSAARTALVLLGGAPSVISINVGNDRRTSVVTLSWQHATEILTKVRDELRHELVLLGVTELPED